MAQQSRRALVLILFVVSAADVGAEMIDGDGVESDLAASVVVETAANPLTLLAPSDAIVIDFDAFSAPCGFPSTTALRDAFADLGVLFDGPGGNDGGAILDACSSFGVSGYSSPNFLAFNENSHLADGAAPRSPETLLFDPLVSLVEVMAGSLTGAGQELTITAFGPDGDFVDMDSLILTSALQPLSVAGSAIREIVVGGAGVFVLDDLAFIEATIEVGVDIRPHNNLNHVRPSVRGLIPVAILGSESFDVADVDAATLAFGHNGAPRAHSREPRFKDVNSDGFTDLVEHFRSDESGIEFGQMEACITGATLDGAHFKGCDTIRTIPDMDGDDLRDRVEKKIGTDPLDPDTDGDGFLDGEEVLVMRTNPLDAWDPPLPPGE